MMRKEWLGSQEVFRENGIFWLNSWKGLESTQIKKQNVSIYSLNVKKKASKYIFITFDFMSLNVTDISLVLINLIFVENKSMPLFLVNEFLVFLIFLTSTSGK